MPKVTGCKISPQSIDDYIQSSFIDMADRFMETSYHENHDCVNSNDLDVTTLAQMTPETLFVADCLKEINDRGRRYGKVKRVIYLT